MTNTMITHHVESIKHAEKRKGGEKKCERKRKKRKWKREGGGKKPHSRGGSENICGHDFFNRNFRGVAVFSSNLKEQKKK